MFISLVILLHEKLLLMHLLPQTRRANYEIHTMRILRLLNLNGMVNCGDKIAIRSDSKQINYL